MVFLRVAGPHEPPQEIKPIPLMALLTDTLTGLKALTLFLYLFF
jgi:hypothetical protein